jgi:site-specific DNA-methyltransferase (adenine-specific)
MKLILGDCLEKLKELPDNSIDSVVTDPPYGIGFMNKEWDNPAKHRELIEREKKRSEERFEEGKSPAKAGFSTGVQPGLAIGGAKEGKWFQEWCEEWGRECLRVLKPGGYLVSFSAPRTYHRMTTGLEDAGFEIRDQLMWVFGSGFPKSYNLKGEYEGWGTALKPAHEPIVMARKPLSEKNNLENVKRWGTGAININDCRVELKEGEDISVVRNSEKEMDTREQGWGFKSLSRGNEGRFPANIIFDDDTDVSWKRYFYCPKTSKKDREDMNNHPTVKPTDLMLYLIKLVTPVGGTVLEPFMGSGSTGKAAIRGGFDFVGIEKEEEYLKISQERIENEYRHQSN